MSRTGHDRRSVFSVQPLYSGDEQLGYFLFEDRSQNSLLTELFRAQISMSIRAALLFREKRRLFDEQERRARELQALTENLAYSNAELEQFAFIASHDLQEPLRKISVFADKLKSEYERVPPDEGRSVLTRILTSCRHMKNLIDALLTYARLANAPAAFSLLDTAGAVRDVLSDLDPVIERESAEIRIGELPDIEAEPLHFRQLFQNLVANALKFHRAGVPPSVAVSGRLVTVAGRECAEYSVADNGIGIDEKHHKRIFILFQRLHGAKEYDGTGIGLAICQRVVERHEGTIRVESRPGAGSTFIVTLPVRRARAG